MPENKASVVFLWHMHQPSYDDPEGGIPLMPWVRLHATRAYRDLAWILERHPDVRMVVNFVPSLVDQLERVVAGGSDHFRELTRKPAALLTPDERQFISVHFFSCHKERLIDPVPRFAELWDRRHDVQHWSEQDLTDLQVHFNLAWMGPAAREEEPVVEQLLRQGRNFSASQKEALLWAQDRVVARVLPAWKALADRGQVELTTTPYYHPILPLLIDSDVASRCQPDAPLPRRFAWPEDARLQVERAMERHEQVFGARPVGMWPAEGAVSPEAVAMMAEAGVRWLATDEGILLRSMRPGLVREAVLYKAYRAPDQGPMILFRDRDVSDRIGFTYARMDTSAAVDDLMARLGAAAEHPERGVILVALDGENPWESYPNGGRDFLDLLCERLAGDESVSTVLPRDLPVEQAEPLPRLHSGSWIDSSYRIWIGSHVENRAWTMLGRARDMVDKALAAGHPGAREALEVLLPAEGSDWFWWFGDDFVTTQEAMFDRLFRARLRRAYELCGVVSPAELDAPVDDRRTRTDEQPMGLAPPPAFVSPTIDGRVTSYYDWAGAARVDLGGGRGAMFQGQRHMERLFYGYDVDNLYLRVDMARGTVISGKAQARSLTVSVRAAGRTHRVEIPVVVVGQGNLRPRPAIVELGVPLNSLGAEPGERIGLRIEVQEQGMVVDSYPDTGFTEILLPEENLLSWSWTG